METGLITIQALADSLGKSVNTVRTWKHRGEIPANCFKKIGRITYVRIDKFKEFVDN